MKFLAFLKKFYIWIIISIFYIPILMMTILSFNKPQVRNWISWTAWNGFSWNSWEQLANKSLGFALLNSFIIGLTVAIIVTTLALITVYGMWRQKQFYRTFINGSANVPLINPDIITAISLSIALSAMFGTLSISQEGMLRVIISHSVTIFPYAILLLFPRSEKFKRSLLEASQDLGYNKLVSWFKIYVVYMMPIILVTMGVAIMLSFDDFIITRTVSNISTIGVRLYEGQFKGWALSLGSILVIIVLGGSSIYAYLKSQKAKKLKKTKGDYH